jgi:hypothetical protein
VSPFLPSSFLFIQRSYLSPLPGRLGLPPTAVEGELTIDWKRELGSNESKSTKKLDRPDGHSWMNKVERRKSKWVSTQEYNRRLKVKVGMKVPQGSARTVGA